MVVLAHSAEEESIGANNGNGESVKARTKTAGEKEERKKKRENEVEIKGGTDKHTRIRTNMDRDGINESGDDEQKNSREIRKCTSKKRAYNR